MRGFALTRMIPRGRKCTLSSQYLDQTSRHSDANQTCIVLPALGASPAISV
jgi:hypothetical protein